MECFMERMDETTSTLSTLENTLLCLETENCNQRQHSEDILNDCRTEVCNNRCRGTILDQHSCGLICHNYLKIKSQNFMTKTFPNHKTTSDPKNSFILPFFVEQQSPYSGSIKRMLDRDLGRTKRYRLGLYDCISSYCGGAMGTDRENCIIKNCHRSL